MRGLAAVLLGLALVVGPAAAQTPDEIRAEAEIRAAIEKTSSDLRAAWQARDAALVFPTDEAKRTDLQRRMDQTVSILQMTELPTKLHIAGSEATMISEQLSRRMVRQADGGTRERIATATHKRTFIRSTAGEWKEDRLELLGQTGRWADGKP